MDKLLWFRGSKGKIKFTAILTCNTAFKLRGEILVADSSLKPFIENKRTRLV